MPSDAAGIVDGQDYTSNPESKWKGMSMSGRGRPKKTAPSSATRGDQVAEPVAPKDAESAMSESDKPYKSKVHAVELALEKLGWDAMPAKIREYLRDKFDLEMTTAHIGVNKTNVLRKRGVIAGPDGSTATPTVTARAPRTYRRSGERGTLIAVENFDTVRGLLKEYDAETILEIGEVLEKVGVAHLREIVRLLS